jgi:hypothetical protein
MLEAELWDRSDRTIELIRTHLAPLLAGVGSSCLPCIVGISSLTGDCLASALRQRQ